MRKNQLFTAKEVATYLGLTASTVRVKMPKTPSQMTVLFGLTHATCALILGQLLRGLTLKNQKEPVIMQKLNKSTTKHHRQSCIPLHLFIYNWWSQKHPYVFPSPLKGGYQYVY